MQSFHWLNHILHQRAQARTVTQLSLQFLSQNSSSERPIQPVVLVGASCSAYCSINYRQLVEQFGKCAVGMAQHASVVLYSRLRSEVEQRIGTTSAEDIAWLLDSSPAPLSLVSNSPSILHSSILIKNSAHPHPLPPSPVNNNNTQSILLIPLASSQNGDTRCAASFNQLNPLELPQSIKTPLHLSDSTRLLFSPVRMLVQLTALQQASVLWLNNGRAILFAACIQPGSSDLLLLEFQLFDESGMVMKRVVIRDENACPLCVSRSDRCQCSSPSALNLYSHEMRSSNWREATSALNILFKQRSIASGSLYVFNPLGNEPHNPVAVYPVCNKVEMVMASSPFDSSTSNTRFSHVPVELELCMNSVIREYYSSGYNNNTMMSLLPLPSLPPMARAGNSHAATPPDPFRILEDSPKTWRDPQKSSLEFLLHGYDDDLGAGEQLVATVGAAFDTDKADAKNSERQTESNNTKNASRKRKESAAAGIDGKSAAEKRVRGKKAAASANALVGMNPQSLDVVASSSYNNPADYLLKPIQAQIGLDPSDMHAFAGTAKAKRGKASNNNNNKSSSKTGMESNGVELNVPFGVQGSTSRGCVKSGDRERPYACEQCGKQFKRSHHVYEHIQAMHMTEKMFECDVCGRKFGIKSNMRKHQVSLHEKPRENPFGCPMCDRGFRTVGNLKQHYAKRHKQSGVPVDLAINAAALGESATKSSNPPAHNASSSEQQLLFP